MSKFKFLWIFLILLLAACQPTAPATTSSPTVATAATTPTIAAQTTPTKAANLTPATTATTTTPSAAATVTGTTPTTAAGTPTAGGAAATPAATITTTTTPGTSAVVTTTPTAMITGTAKLVDDSLAALGKLKSYEATLTMKTEGLSADGNQNLSFDYRIAASDRWAISGTVNTPQTQQLNVIRIGDNIYVQDPTKGQVWVQGSAASMSSSFEGLLPDKLLAGLPELLSEFPPTSEPKTVGTETISGTETTHYNSTINNYTSPDGSVIEQSNLDLWVAKQGDYPARMTMTLAGTSKEKQKETFDVRLEVRNANGNIQIEPPPPDKIISVGGTQATPTGASATPTAGY